MLTLFAIILVVGSIAGYFFYRQEPLPPRYISQGDLPPINTPNGHNTSQVDPRD